MKTLTKTFEEILKQFEIIIIGTTNQYDLEKAREHFREDLLQAVKERDAYVIGEKDILINLANRGKKNTATKRRWARNNLREEQHKRAEESL